eukprot:m.121053 g.121053  ORF g.121053 m.121053 type:complete len:254 (+) comp17260_c0_seq6:185-946(+)
MPPLALVQVNADVFMTCLSHALSTEREEVMGLLIGETGSYAHPVAKVSALLILNRVDKRKDRCEISSEQLVAATSYAETLARSSGRPLRVVGWYHSHPHITVWPSHVDLHTQQSWQAMESTFVGLIFSCFNSDAAHHGRIEATAFQTASDGGRLEVPMEVIPANCHRQSSLSALATLPSTFFQEEREEFRRAQMSCEGAPLIVVHNSAVYVVSFSSRVVNYILLQCRACCFIQPQRVTHDPIKFNVCRFIQLS